MPKLLKSGEVQLHMPKTGGSSLAAEIGIKELCGTQHDGAEKIPEKWKGFPTVATFRDRENWERSMLNYLEKIGALVHRKNFRLYRPADVRKGIDPRFGLWGDSNHIPDKLYWIAASGLVDNWYKLYTEYFIRPADRIIKIDELKLHKNKTLV